MNSSFLDVGEVRGIVGTGVLKGLGRDRNRVLLTRIRPWIELTLVAPFPLVGQNFLDAVCADEGPTSAQSCSAQALKGVVDQDTAAEAPLIK